MRRLVASNLLEDLFNYAQVRPETSVLLLWPNLSKVPLACRSGSQGGEEKNYVVSGQQYYYGNWISPDRITRRSHSDGL